MLYEEEETTPVGEGEIIGAKSEGFEKSMNERPKTIKFDLGRQKYANSRWALNSAFLSCPHNHGPSVAQL